MRAQASSGRLRGERGARTLRALPQATRRLPLGAPFKTDATPTVAFFVRPTYRESRIPPPPPDFEGSYGRGVIGRAHRDQISEKSLRGKMPSTAVLLSWRPTTLHWLFYTVQSRQAPLGKKPVDCQIRAHDFALFALVRPPGAEPQGHMHRHDVSDGCAMRWGVAPMGGLWVQWFKHSRA